MRVAVVGAGPSGLAAARAMRELGCDVTVFEAAPDIGGVWSESRRYPGIATQNDKRTYAFSDLPMPAECAEAPAGADVRAYLTEFARRNALLPLLRLGTVVENAEPTPHGWAFDARGPDGTHRVAVDWLVVANGLSSKPFTPAFPGRAGFEAAGGLVLSPSDVGDGEALRGRDVVVVGWGKSAGDIATTAAGVARSVTVVARGIGWKLPREIRGVSFQRVMLSRLGEFLIWGPSRTLFGRVARALTQPARAAVVRVLGRIVSGQLELRRRGLLPDVPADHLDHLITDGFLEAIDAGRVVVRRGASVAELGSDEGAGGVRIGSARLADGTALAADVIVAATGYDQDLGLLTEAARRTVTNRDGDLELIRYTLPTSGSRLAFIGWVNSFRNPITAEMQSLWLAAIMLGLAQPPDRARRRPFVFRLSHESAADRGLPQLPQNGSILTIDQWLADLDLSVPWWQRRAELLGPVIPSVYADRLARLRERAAARAAGSGAAPGSEPESPRPAAESMGSTTASATASATATALADAAPAPRG